MTEDAFANLTEELIKEYTDEQSFERGLNYYFDGAIFDASIIGTTLTAYCHGRQQEPYTVKATFEKGSLSSAFCNCPRGGFCKHIVALLLNYIHNPDEFSRTSEIDSILSSLSKKQLLELIHNMIAHDHTLVTKIKFLAPLPKEFSIDLEAVIRDIYKSFKSQDPDRIDADLRRILSKADKLEERKEWLLAGNIYKEVLGALCTEYDDYLMNLDYDGDLTVVSGYAIEGLEECLTALEQDHVARREWLLTILEAILTDIGFGGIGFAEDADEILLTKSSDQEWSMLEKRILETLSGLEDWGKEQLVDMLAEWLINKGMHQEASEIIRRYGSKEQLLFLLVNEKRFQEAADLALNDFYDLPGVIDRLANRLVEAGAKEIAVKLHTKLLALNDRHRHYRYVQWLAGYYYKLGNQAEARKWYSMLFLDMNRLGDYEVIHQLSLTLNDWTEVRSELINSLENSGKTRALLDIALYEKDIDRALELLTQLGPAAWPEIRSKVANAAEKKRPVQALALYKELVEIAIGVKNRGGYKQAAAFLKKIKKLYKKLDKQEEWNRYISSLKNEYARYPALQDELNKAKL